MEERISTEIIGPKSTEFVPTEYKPTEFVSRKHFVPCEVTPGHSNVKDICAIALPASAYAAILMQSFKDGTDFEEILAASRLDSDIEELLRSHLNEDWLDFSRQLSKQYTGADLASLVVNFSFEKEGRGLSSYYRYATDETISALAYSLLDIESSDVVADFGCGYGNFLTTVAKHVNNVSLYGAEQDRTLIGLTKMRLSLLDCSYEVEIDDVPYNASNRKFDKVFARVQESKIKGSIADYYYCMGTSSLSDAKLDKLSAEHAWNYIERIYASLTSNGRAVVVVPANLIRSDSSKIPRSMFIATGRVQAIIDIDSNEPGENPSYLHSHSDRDIILVLGDNEESAFNAISCSGKKGRNSTIAGDDIARIKKAIFEGSDDAVSITVERAAKLNYSLDPFDYQKDWNSSRPSYGNVQSSAMFFGWVSDRPMKRVPLETLTESIMRGVNLSKNEFDLIKTSEDTHCRYLRLSDIAAGRIVPSPAQNVRAVGSRLHRYHIETGDVILSRNAPFKVAVAEVEEGQTIVASGNMYIIRLRPGINPYFILAYLASDTGQKELLSKATNRTIASISMANLKRLAVIDCSEEKQEIIGDEYRDYLSDFWEADGDTEQYGKHSVFFEEVFSGEPCV